MFIEMPHKKMKYVNRFGIVGQCDCGHEQKFNGNDVDVDKSGSSVIIFKDIYTCSKCGTTYDGIFEEIKNRDVWYRRGSLSGNIIALFVIIGLLFGGYKAMQVFFYTPPVNTDINKATNKELNDFYKWDNKQQQEKRDNQPAFNNN